MSLAQELAEIGAQARLASDGLRSLSRAVKDEALRRIAARLRESRAVLQAANAKDLEAGRAKGLSAADRKSVV